MHLCISIESRTCEKIFIHPFSAYPGGKTLNIPDVPLPRNILQLFPRPHERYNLSNLPVGLL